MKRTYIIAEAGVNHNGNIVLAHKMIDVAVETGADAIKFQTAIPELVMTRFVGKAKYQKENTGSDESQLDMCKRIHLPLDAYGELKKHADECGIEFLSAPFDMVSIDELERIGVSKFKIPSGEITNKPYLQKIGSLKKPVILSTGISTLGDIETAVGILVDSGQKRESIVLLHCTTQYPAPYASVNLNAMITMRDSFKLSIGYSDHTIGNEVSMAAVALGAMIIEKHFTLDRNMEGPDHIASMEPDELKNLVRQIRNIDEAMGDGIKKPSGHEIENQDIVRKSIVALRHINKGELLTAENITTKRPGSGLSPLLWNRVINTTAIRDFDEDELIEI